MTKEKTSYFGVRRKKEKGFTHPIALKIASSLSSFDEHEPDAAHSEDSDNATHPGGERPGFGQIQSSYFESMLGFLDISVSGPLAFIVLQSVQIEEFIKSEIMPMALGAHTVDEWDVHELHKESVARVYRQAGSLIRKLDQTTTINHLLLLGLVSKFDAYLGRLIRELAFHKPHIVFQSEKTYTASEIFK